MNVILNVSKDFGGLFKKIRLRKVCNNTTTTDKSIFTLLTLLYSAIIDHYLIQDNQYLCQ